MTRRALFGFVLWIALAPAYAATWEIVGDNPALTVEVDRESIRREQKLVRAWFRWEYTDTQYTTRDRKAFRSMKELNVFNCAKRQYAIAQRVAYSETNSRGASVFSETVSADHLAYEEVIPESIGESMLVYVCKSPQSTR